MLTATIKQLGNRVQIVTVTPKSGEYVWQQNKCSLLGVSSVYHQSGHVSVAWKHQNLQGAGAAHVERLWVHMQQQSLVISHVSLDLNRDLHG